MTAFLAYRFLPAAGLVVGGLLAAGNVFQATALEPGCVAGLALLSGGGDGTLLGDCLALLAALTFGGHILALGTLGRRYAPGPTATIQLATCGILFLAVAPFTGGLPVPHGAVEWRAIAVTSIGCGAIAFAVQSLAQRRIAPARARPSSSPVSRPSPPSPDDSSPATASQSPAGSERRSCTGRLELAAAA